MIYIGRKAPKGYREVGKSMHIGFGVWIMRVEKIERQQAKSAYYDPKQFRRQR